MTDKILELLNDESDNYTDNNNYYKARYMQQIKNAFKHNSLKEMNENNEYTPMYINAYNLFKDNSYP